MTDEPVGDLLARLASGSANAAWREFLDDYSPLLMRIARRHAADEERARDVFVHVCGELSDCDFKRLLRFRPDGQARFRTWLSAVATNLCIDWLRKQHGRPRPLRVLEQLPELDRTVYRHLYVRRVPRDECLQLLQPRFPELTGQRLSEINARLFLLLTPQQRWQLNVRAAGSVALQDCGDASDEPDKRQFRVEDPNPGPEAAAQSDQETQQARAAMAQLPHHQRLLLRLRYEQELTLEEIARLTGVGDPYRVHRQIHAALAAMADMMKR